MEGGIELQTFNQMQRMGGAPARPRYEPIGAEDGPGMHADGLVMGPRGDDGPPPPDADSPWTLTHALIVILLLLLCVPAIMAAVQAWAYGADNKGLNNDILDCLGQLKNTTADILGNTETIIITTNTILSVVNQLILDVADLCAKILVLTDLVNTTSTTIINNTEVIIGNTDTLEDGQAEILECLGELKNKTACTPITQADLPRLIDESGCYEFAEELEWLTTQATAVIIRASNVELRGNNHNLTLIDDGWGIDIQGSSDVQLHNIALVAVNGVQHTDSLGIWIIHSRHVLLEDVYMQNLYRSVNIFDSSSVAMHRLSIFASTVDTSGNLFGVRALRSQGLVLHDSLINISDIGYSSVCIAQVDAPSQGMDIARTTAICSASALVVLGGEGVSVESSYLEATRTFQGTPVACMIGSPYAEDRTYGTVLRNTVCKVSDFVGDALWAVNALSLVVDHCTLNATLPSSFFTGALHVGAREMVPWQTEEIVNVHDSVMWAHPLALNTLIDQTAGTTYVHDSLIEGGAINTWVTQNSTVLKDNTMRGGSFLGVLIDSETATPASHNIVQGNRIMDNCDAGLVFDSASYANIAENNFLTGNEAGATDAGVANVLNNIETGNTKPGDECPLFFRRRSLDPVAVEDRVRAAVAEFIGRDHTEQLERIQAMSAALRQE